LAFQRSRRWAWLGLAFRLAVAVFVVCALGFPVFVWSLSRSSSEPEPADAIIALTGGEGRLQAAIELLDQGKGSRLLISGVHEETTRVELFDAAGGMPKRAACCVDLGRSAENTIGNAGEAAAWIGVGSPCRRANQSWITEGTGIARAVVDSEVFLEDRPQGLASRCRPERLLGHDGVAQRVVSGPVRFLG
jgi:hypothetical protein